MDAYAIEAKEKMEKSIAAFKVGLSKLRSGRANPAMLNGIMCDYYGEKMDITSLSSISMPEPRQLLVKPYSREDLKTIGSAIAAANLGINPQIEADAIRIIVPPMTEEIRKDIVKKAGITRLVTTLDPLTRKEVKRPIYEVASSHMARRTFIGNIYKQVKDQHLVSSLTGHSDNSRAFVRYRNIDIDMKQELVNILD